uniref:Uncharacterized protein LOC100367271 n=1 Tax=Saccoglossus kowalevskii TaxID=10224 RepID=A0ABM0GT08_SACKO|nr:PREDICTED: uncharacterized protein LOC100367271 [Saccoglossus kowalevskii]
MSDLPTTTEVLGEHLYSLIDPLQPQYSDKITGMLLELGNEEVIQLLQYPELLKKRVWAAMEVLQREGNIKSHADKELLGEKLYTKVDAIEPVYCAKITGMLLEMEAISIHQLLLSEKDLVLAVNKAKIALQQENNSETETENEKFGEELYSIIEQKYPEHASKITGMMLELKHCDLVKLMNNRILLESKIQVALKVIQSNENDCM